MPDELIQLEIRAAVRYLNMDWREFVRLRDRAAEIYEQIEEEEERRRRLYVPVREILEWKRCEKIS